MPVKKRVPEVKNDLEKQRLKKIPAKKTNRGCWIVAGVGCGLVVLLIGGLFMLFVLLAAVGSDLGGTVGEEVLYEGTGGKIAVISLDGIISESESSDVFSVTGISIKDINNQIDKALADDDVEGILIKMNSPGGEAVASDLIYNKVMEAREEKKVVTWMSGMGASGGYLIAAGSDKIVSHPGCLTGSIGVILQLSNMDDLYEKVGIQVKTFKSGEFKDDEGVFDDDKDGEADVIFQDLIDESYDDFVNAIVDGRDMDKTKVVELADGRIYTGRQAYENGLVDEIGYMDDAIGVLEDLVGKGDLSIVEYSSGGFWSSFYEYQSLLLDKINLLPEKTSYNVGMYYLLDY